MVPQTWSQRLVGEGTGGGWVFGEKFDLGEFKRKVSRSEDGDKYRGVRE